MDEEPTTPLALALAQAAPRQRRALERVCEEIGIRPGRLKAWTEGRGAPVGWIRRRIAEALELDDARRLFPDPKGRHRPPKSVRANQQALAGQKRPAPDSTPTRAQDSTTNTPLRGRNLND